ncbi:MAG: anaerobic ribonucleoside-triphosphate reductase activating protein [Clostridia bacterium]|nr:anaerobic ribonucleoside-triphosphate reductase activating protein [Clostridia bacterium]
MRISGLQKLTLLDYPEKVACTVFTFGCNFRCPFCHNAGLVVGEQPEEIKEDDFFAYLDKRKGVLDGVAITGGEPTLQKDLIPFIKRIKEKGLSVKLDTNGARPEVIKEILDQGIVDYFAMDIKNGPKKYAATAGVDIDLNKIKESIALLIERAPDYEFRTTVVKGFHEKGDFLEIGKMIAGAKKYFLQKFTDSGAILGTGVGPCNEEEMEGFLKEAKEYVPEAKIRGKE